MPTAPSKALPIPPPLLPSKPADTITAAINEGENDTGVEVKEEGGEGGEEEEEEDPSTSSSPPLYSVAVNSDGEEIDGEGEDEEVADEEAAKAAAEKEEEERRKKKAAEDEDLAKIKPESLIYTKKEIGLLQDVLDVFIEKSPAAIELMFEKVGKEKLDEFANALVTLTFAHSTTLALVLYFVGEEFARNGHSEGGIKVLFRENSVASKMLKAYIQHVGGQYLQELLGGLIRDVCYVEQKVSFEIDPSRAEGGAAEVERNLAQLLAKLEAVMGRITSGSMVARMPQGIRAIAAYFAESSRRYWPDKPSDILLGSFLMLRYINPAIAAPETAGLLPRSGRYAGQPLTPRARRNLLLITKVLQNMSNGVLFTQKEQYMLPLNPFLQAYTPRLQRYYQSIVAAAGACSTNLVVDSDIAAPGPREAYDLHRLLFAARDEVAHLLTGTADRARLDALLDALGPYTRKASFPRVIGAEPAAQARVRQLLAKYNDAPVFVAPYETAPEPVTSLAIYASRNPESSTSSITTTSTVTLPPIGGDNSNNNSGVCNNEDDDDDDDEAAAASGDNVVIVGSNRVFVVRKKPLKGSILKCGGHLLDLTEIRSRTPRELTFTFKTFSITGFCDASSEVIECAVRAYMANFACAPPAQRFRVAIAPPPRAEAIASTLAAAEAAAADAAAHTRGCAGLLGTYMSLCDYYGQPANESVCWDLENLYENDATLDLRRFGFDEGAEQEELVPLFHALRYDSHFTGLASDGVRLKGAPSAVVLQLGETLRLNSSLTSLTIADAALPDKAAVVLFDALTASAAAACAITALDVSGNAIEEKGAAALGRFVCARAAKSSSGGGKDSGLVSLNVEDALTSTKAVAALGTELVKSVRATLRTLNVSQNKIGDAYAEIGAFLQSPGGGAEIVDLDISGTFLTGQKLTGLLHAIAKGCKRLARLGAANVKFSKPEDLLFISQMLISNNTLRDLDLAGSLPSARFLGDLISCAPADAALRISIADNTFSESAALFYQVLPKVQTLAHLDLSNTDLGDDGVFHVAENLTLNTALRSLNISGCFRADKRPRLEAIHALEKLVNSDCPLEALYIAGGQKTAQQIGKFLPQLLQAFRTNKTIATLDVSAHAAGPRGALAMSKLLMINKTLTDIRMEQNNIGVNGLSVLAQSLKASHSVVSFPLPIIDIASMLSGSSSAVQKKIHTLCVEIEKSVISNNSSNSSSSSVGNTTTSNSSNNNNNNGNRK